jgi:hypothetical protein
MALAMARPQHQPTDEQRRQVMTLAGLGIKQEEIASLLRLAPKTLRLRYRHELDTGTTEASVRVAQSLFENATRYRNVTAQIFWLKVRANWRDRQDINVNSIQTVQMQHLVAAQAVSDALHNAPDTLPQIEGTVDSEDEADAPPHDLMQAALE